MSEQSRQFVPVNTQGRPFPWFCPNCRRQEVRRAIIPYQCQRFDNGQPLTVVLSALEVPQCGHCGELVFTYDTEEQINRAYRAQADAQGAGTTPANGAEVRTGDRTAKS